MESWKKFLLALQASFLKIAPDFDTIEENALLSPKREVNAEKRQFSHF